MSSSIIIPFNWKSVSTSQKTTSYTVPSGKYAVALPLEWFCTVDGSEIAIKERGSFTTASNTTYSICDYLGNPIKLALTRLTGSGNATIKQGMSEISSAPGTTTTTEDIRGRNLFTTSGASQTNTINSIFYNLPGTAVAVSASISSSTYTGPNVTTMTARTISGLFIAEASTTTRTVAWEKYVSMPQSFISYPSGTVLTGGYWQVMEFNEIT